MSKNVANQAVPVSRVVEYWGCCRNFKHFLSMFSMAWDVLMIGDVLIRMFETQGGQTMCRQKSR